MEARSKAHYKLVWEEEIKRLNYLRWLSSKEDGERIEAIQNELREIKDRCAENLNKPDTCPQCADTLENGKTYFCAYREDCPENHLTIPSE